ncbi:MAG: 5,10-methylenetetrahydrofolate reductase [Gammaproteobacteria bacterium TMED234]|nr:MAG: 5,10-methylenetetrahydrofolate reductase [Gammaproteobacteria bacterium TMED234]|tara:strand:- start:132 stop:983 length:852 start_codon:yes stop_codon:yes gene_type:complete
MSNPIKKFLNDFSIEVTPRAVAKIENLSELIPPETLVYIAHIEGTPIDEMVKTAKKINDQGYVTMPHFPARIIKDKNTLKDWISRYQNEANVNNALLLGGGVKKPYGDYDSSIQLIESELFDIAGFNKLYFAGHPEGNKDIDPDGSTKNIDEALSWKNDFRNRTDADMAITTQFCFDSKTVINWANDIKNKGINIPIHIGIAGPAKLQTLLRYSIECGVGASIKILQKRALDLTKLLLPYKPTNILSELAEYKFNNPDLNIEKVHFFPLGGVKQVSKFVRDIA